jgi:metal transporter CNNM
VLLSVTAVLFFGEVIPQGVCIGPNQMAIASGAVPLVKFLMAITSPISWPLSKLLDHLLGEHKLTRFSAPELKAIIEMHGADMIQNN